MTTSTPAVDLTQAVPVVMPLLYWKLLLGFFEELSDAFGSAGCNDFPLTITPENAPALEQLLRLTEAASGGPMSEEALQGRLARALSSGRLYFHDGALLGQIKATVKSQVLTTPIYRP